MGDAYFGKRAFCIVTGASQGIGKGIAIALAARFGAKSAVALVARNEQRLAETRAAIVARQPSHRVLCHSVDLRRATATDFERVVQSTLAGEAAAAFDVAILVHNATLYVDYLIEKRLVDAAETAPWDDALHANVVTYVSLTSAFLRAFGQTRGHKLVVGLGDRLDFAVDGLGFHFMQESARQWYFHSLLKEESANIANLRVTTYAPGVVQTSLNKLLRETTFSDKLQTMCVETPKCTVEETSERLCDLLAEDKFENGGIIMYSEAIQESLVDISHK